MIWMVYIRLVLYMSDLWLNIRFWVYHFQAGREQWWNVQISKNNFHRKNWCIFAIYQISIPRSYIGGRTETDNG